MAAFVASSATWNTTAGNKTVAPTPAVGELIVVVVAASGMTSGLTVTDNQTGGTYTQIGTFALGNTSVDCIGIFVRNSLVASAVAHTITAGESTSTGGGLVALRFSGMSRVAAAAVRTVLGTQQFAKQQNVAAGTPAPVFPVAASTLNAVIGAVLTASNSTVNTVPPSGWTEQQDLGYNTPTTGIEVATRDSGETGTTITWGGATPSIFASLIIELEAGAPDAELAAAEPNYNGLGRVSAFLDDEDAEHYDYYAQTLDAIEAFVAGPPPSPIDVPGIVALLGYDAMPAWQLDEYPPEGSEELSSVHGDPSAPLFPPAAPASQPVDETGLRWFSASGTNVSETGLRAPNGITDEAGRRVQLVSPETAGGGPTIAELVAADPNYSGTVRLSGFYEDFDDEPYDYYASAPSTLDIAPWYQSHRTIVWLDASQAFAASADGDSAATLPDASGSGNAFTSSTGPTVHKAQQWAAFEPKAVVFNPSRTGVTSYYDGPSLANQLTGQATLLIVFRPGANQQTENPADYSVFPDDQKFTLFANNSNDSWSVDLGQSPHSYFGPWRTSRLAGYPADEIVPTSGVHLLLLTVNASGVYRVWTETADAGDGSSGFVFDLGDRSKLLGTDPDPQGQQRGLTGYFAEMQILNWEVTPVERQALIDAAVTKWLADPHAAVASVLEPTTDLEHDDYDYWTTIYDGAADAFVAGPPVVASDAYIAALDLPDHTDQPDEDDAFDFYDPWVEQAEAITGFLAPDVEITIAAQPSRAEDTATDFPDRTDDTEEQAVEPVHVQPEEYIAGSTPAEDPIYAAQFYAEFDVELLWPDDEPISGPCQPWVEQAEAVVGFLTVEDDIAEAAQLDRSVGQDDDQAWLAGDPTDVAPFIDGAEAILGFLTIEDEIAEAAQLPRDIGWFSEDFEQANDPTDIWPFLDEQEELIAGPPLFADDGYIATVDVFDHSDEPAPDDAFDFYATTQEGIEWSIGFLAPDVEITIGAQPSRGEDTGLDNPDWDYTNDQPYVEQAEAVVGFLAPDAEIAEAAQLDRSVGQDDDQAWIVTDPTDVWPFTDQGEWFTAGSPVTDDFIASAAPHVESVAVDFPERIDDTEEQSVETVQIQPEENVAGSTPGDDPLYLSQLAPDLGWSPEDYPEYEPVSIDAAGASDVSTIEAYTAGPPPSLLPAYDSFNRPDAGALGTSDSGHLWTDSTGVFTIASNQALETSGALDPFSTIDIGVSDQQIEADAVSATAQQHLAVRVSGNGANALIAGWQSSTNSVSMFARVANTYTQLGTSVPVGKHTGRLRLEAIGSQINLYVDDVLAISQTDVTVPLATRCGLFGRAAAFDNFNALNGAIATYSLPEQAWFPEQDTEDYANDTALDATSAFFPPAVADDYIATTALVPDHSDQPAPDDAWDGWAYPVEASEWFIGFLAPDAEIADAAQDHTAGQDDDQLWTLADPTDVAPFVDGIEYLTGFLVPADEIAQAAQPAPDVGWSFDDYPEPYQEAVDATALPTTEVVAWQFIGLRVWLDTTQIVGKVDGDPVSTWPDQTGLGYNATAGAGAEPRYTAAGLNGLPVLVTDGVNDQMDIAGLILGANVPRTIYMVGYRAQAVLPPGPPDMWQITSVAGVMDSSNAGYTWFSSQAGSSPQIGTLDPRDAQLLTVRITDAGTLDAWTMGLGPITIDPEDTAFGAINGMTVFYRSSTSGRGQFAMGELRIYAGAHTDAERQVIETELLAKWFDVSDYEAAGQLGWAGLGWDVADYPDFDAAPDANATTDVSAFAAFLSPDAEVAEAAQLDRSVGQDDDATWTGTDPTDIVPFLDGAVALTRPDDAFEVTIATQLGTDVGQDLDLLNPPDLSQLDTGYVEQAEGYVAGPPAFAPDAETIASQPAETGIDVEGRWPEWDGTDATPFLDGAEWFIGFTVPDVEITTAAQPSRAEDTAIDNPDRIEWTEETDPATTLDLSPLVRADDPIEVTLATQPDASVGQDDDQWWTLLDPTDTTPFIDEQEEAIAGSTPADDPIYAAQAWPDVATTEYAPEETTDYANDTALDLSPLTFGPDAFDLTIATQLDPSAGQDDDQGWIAADPTDIWPFTDQLEAFEEIVTPDEGIAATQDYSDAQYEPEALWAPESLSDGAIEFIASDIEQALLPAATALSEPAAEPEDEAWPIYLALPDQSGEFAATQLDIALVAALDVSAALVDEPEAWHPEVALADGIEQVAVTTEAAVTVAAQPTFDAYDWTTSEQPVSDLTTTDRQPIPNQPSARPDIVPMVALVDPGVDLVALKDPEVGFPTGGGFSSGFSSGFQRGGGTGELDALAESEGYAMGPYGAPAPDHVSALEGEVEQIDALSDPDVDVT